MRIQGGPHAADMAALPALRWPPRRSSPATATITTASTPRPPARAPRWRPPAAAPTTAPSARRTTSANRYRRRPLATILEELDGLIALGVEYVYFIDEIFLPNRELLEALADRPVKFGVQTRIDLWNQELLDLLGAAGCVSIEAGVESISPEGRDLLDKNSKLTTEEFTERLIHAKRHVPFVQANLIDARVDDPAEVEAWRSHLQGHGVWVERAGPAVPVPGLARLHEALGRRPTTGRGSGRTSITCGLFDEFSDIQDAAPAAARRPRS